jgi:hypothetical protein
MQPPSQLFVPFTNNDYFQKGVVTFKEGTSISPNDECRYDPVPAQ